MTRVIAVLAVLAPGVLGAMIFARAAEACWARPPEVAWSKSADGKFEIERRNREAVIRIHPLGKRDVTLWSAKLEGFSELFSKVHVVKNGTRVVHVRTNHMVSKLKDVAVAVVEKNGKITKVQAKVLTDQIVRPDLGKPRISTDAGRYWLKSIGKVTNDTLALTDARGRKKVLDLNTGKLAKQLKEKPGAKHGQGASPDNEQKPGVKDNNGPPPDKQQARKVAPPA